MPYSHVRAARSNSATAAMRPAPSAAAGGGDAVNGVNGDDDDGSKSPSGGGGEKEEPVPVVVAVRLKPNPDNLPIAVQANPKKNTITMTAFEDDGDENEEDNNIAGGKNNDDDDDRFVVTRRFNYVFSESSSQETTFSVAVKQFAPLVLVGYDLSVVAYGQSGAGKTYSMFGSDLPFAMNESEFGLVIRLVRELFHQMQQRLQQQDSADDVDEDYRFYVRATFMDIEDDEARDVLSHASANKIWVSPPHEQEDGEEDRDPVQGLTAIECATVDDVISCLESGLSIHKLRADSCNELLIPDMPGGTSSSHSIFTVHIQQQFFAQEKDGGGLQRRTVESTVRFVDLAGADKLTVNRGLLSLDGVVAALGDARRNARDKPRYGDSLLTRILRDSLGGSALTVLLCCVSPLQDDATETENAVRFACRAANISNYPRPRVTVAGRSQMGSDVGGGGGRRDSDLRSASVNRGRLPQIQQQLLAAGGGFAAPPNPHLNIFAQQPYSYEQQQLILYNHHLQQQMAAHLNTPSLLTSPSSVLTQQLAAFHHHQMLLNLSSPLAGPLTHQASPYSAAAQMHLQASPAEQQQQQMLLQDPAAVPISLSSRLGDLDLLTDEDDLAQRSEEAARSFLRQKLASIVEESENSSSAVNSSASVAAIGSSTKGSSAEEASFSGVNGITDSDSSFEVVSQEDFDSECSDVSAEEEVEEQDQRQKNFVLADVILQFQSDTRKLVGHFQNNCNLNEVLLPSLETPSDKIHTSQSALGGQLPNLAAQNETDGCAIVKKDQQSDLLMPPSTAETLEQRLSLELELLQISSQLEVMKERERKLLQHSAELEAKETKLARERERAQKAFSQADSLRRSYESKLNSMEKASSSPAAASLEITQPSTAKTSDEAQLRSGCKSLRHVQTVLLKQRSKQETRLNELNGALKSLKEFHHNSSHSKPDPSSTTELHHRIVRDLQRNVEERAELDEILSCLDHAVELKNELLCGRTISFDDADDASINNGSSRSRWPELDRHLPGIMSGLSPDECRAHVYRLLSRGVDLRVQSVRADDELAHLEHKCKQLKRVCLELKRGNKMADLQKKTSQTIQEMELRKKYETLEGFMVQVQRVNEDLKDRNKFLLKFYRKYNKEEAAAAAATANATANATPGAAAAYSEIVSAPVPGRHVKQHAVIKDNKLIIPKH